jgi:hypothetical protein
MKTNRGSPVLRYGLIYACLLLPLPVGAGYDEGIAAYRLGDYSRALTELRPLAEQGNGDAQWTLGLMYAQGSGVLQDYIQAHKWLNLAASRGHREAASTRESIARRMTSDQIAEAQRLARAWQPAPAAKPVVPAAPALPPLPSAPASTTTTRRVQALLGERGYDAGPADGVMGRRTRNAIREYQGDHGLTRDGEASAGLLAHIEANPGAVKPGSWADIRPAASPPPPAPPPPIAPASAPPAAPAAHAARAADEERVRAMVAELRQLVHDGEARRSADRAFLRALSDLASRYDNPWARLLLDERFPSAAEAKRRGWVVATGEFEVINQGLRSSVEPARATVAKPQSAEEQALALLGAIVGQTGGNNVRSSSGQPAAEAEVYVPLAIAETFLVEVVFRSARTPAHLQVGLYQGSARTQGYVLGYRSGTGGGGDGVEVTREASYGRNVISRSSGALGIEDGREHTLAWSRDREGAMQVVLDGRTLVDVTERGVGGAFDGLRLRNMGGDFTIRSVTVRASE